MISTSEWRGSIKATPSRAGTSIPSLRHLTLDNNPRSSTPTCRKESRRLERSPAGIAPDTWVAQSFPEGRWSSGSHSFTLEMEWANLLAEDIREWKEITRWRLYSLIALSRPIWIAKVRASVISLPSTVTWRPDSTNSRHSALSTATTTTW